MLANDILQTIAQKQMISTLSFFNAFLVENSISSEQRVIQIIPKVIDKLSYSIQSFLQGFDKIKVDGNENVMLELVQFEEQKSNRLSEYNEKIKRKNKDQSEQKEEEYKKHVVFKKSDNKKSEQKEQASLRYYKQKLDLYKTKNDEKIEKQEKKFNYGKSVEPKHIKMKQKSNLQQSYQKKINFSKLNPQIYQRNKDRKIKQAEQMINSNIQFLNRIKGGLTQKIQLRQWKSNLQKEIRQLKGIKKQKLEDLGFIRNKKHKFELVSQSLILPSVHRPIKKWQLNKPVPFNLYNINRKEKQIFYNIQL